MENEKLEIIDAKHVGVDAVWNFLEEAGFLYPQKRKIIDFDAAKSTMEKLMQSNSNVYKGLVAMRGNAVHGHISAVQMHEGNWMVQHMASKPYKREKVSHALALNLAMLEWFEKSSDVEYIHATYRQENKRVSRLYDKLKSLVGDPALSTTKCLNCMVRDNDTLVKCKPTYHTEFLRSTIHDGYISDGLLRSKSVLGVFDDGIKTFIGRATMELSSPGLNLSELLSATQVQMFSDNPAALHDIVNTASAKYAEFGRKSTVALVDDCDVEKFVSMGFEHFKRYTFWTWHKSLCKTFHEYMSGLSEHS